MLCNPESNIFLDPSRLDVGTARLWEVRTPAVPGSLSALHLSYKRCAPHVAHNLQLALRSMRARLVTCRSSPDRRHDRTSGLTCWGRLNRVSFLIEHIIARRLREDFSTVLFLRGSPKGDEFICWPGLIFITISLDKPTQEACLVELDCTSHWFVR